MTEKNKSIRNFPNYGSVPKLRFSEFTEEWKVKKLGEIGEIVNGLTYNPDNIDDSGILVLRSSNVQNRIVTLKDNVFVKTEKFNPVKENDILICVRNGSKNLIGKNAIIKKENEGLAFGAFMTVFRSLYNKFVFQWFDTKQYKEIVNKNLGATINSINGSDLKKFKIPFPSYEEQQKISSLLSLIDDRIEVSMKIISHLQTSIQSYRQKIFSRKIRFKDISSKDYPDWEIKKLGEIAMRLTNKNKDNNQNVLTISAQYGLISQLEFFNKSVSAKNVTGYYVLNKNDFAYNKSYSNGYPMGAIKKLIKYEKGVVSTLYICFKFHSHINSEFMKQYFDAGFQNDEIEKIAQEGARNHGLLNISISDFFNIEISLPSNNYEQTKIANFLSSIEEKIETEKKILAQYETQKKFFLANLFV
jgi:type I restriction enzyme S subunit